MFEFFPPLSLSLHAILEVWITKVPEQIACILACIAVFLCTSYLQIQTKKRRINSTVSFHVCSLHFLDREQRVETYRFAERTGHAH